MEYIEKPQAGLVNLFDFHFKNNVNRFTHRFAIRRSKGAFCTIAMLKLLLRIMPFIYMTAVFVMSSMPANAIVELPNSQWDAGIKESLHLIEFAILYILLVLASLTMKELTAKLNLVCILIASIYGISDEFHQSFVPYRSATLIDVIKDITGVLTASWVMYNAYHKKRFLKLGAFLRRIEEKHKKGGSHP